MKHSPLPTLTSIEVGSIGVTSIKAVPHTLAPQRLRVDGELYKGVLEWASIVEFMLRAFMEVAYSQKLLATKGYLLLSPVGDDRTLGGIYDSFNKELRGENLWGQALMYCRALLGGQESPAVTALRQTQSLLNHEWSWDVMEDETIVDMVGIFLGRVPKANPESKASIARNEFLTNRQQRLVEFIMRTGWQPLPRLEGVVFSKKDKLPRALRDWMFLLTASKNQPEVLALSQQMSESSFGCNEAHSLKAKVYLGEILLSEVGLGETQVLPVLEEGLQVKDASAFYAWFLGEQTSLLSPEDKTELFEILFLSRGQILTVAGPSVCISDKADFSQHTLTIDFSTRWVIGSMGRLAFPKAVFGNLPGKTDWLLIQLGLMSGGMTSVRGINAVLNGLPNLWVREANYGHQWESDHPTPITKNNSYMPLGVKGICSASQLTGLVFSNDSFGEETIKSVIHLPEFRYSWLTDKTSMKLISSEGTPSLTAIRYTQEAEEALGLLDLGCDAFWVYNTYFKTPEEILDAMKMVFFEGVDPRVPIMFHGGVLVTGLDGSKSTKLLNRGQQFTTFNEVVVNIHFGGKKFQRSQCGLKVARQPLLGVEVIATEKDEEDFLS